jgi:hypothetical protein
MRRTVERIGRGLLVVGLAAMAFGSEAAADSQRRQGPRGVLVVNEADQAVPVREVGRETREPFHRQFVLDWADGTDLSTASYAVPSGKRLVVEYASLSAYLPPSGQSMFVRILTTVGGSDAFHTLALQKREDYGVLKQFEGAHLVKLYADPATTVRVSAGRVPAVDTANCTVTLSGYLVDVP